MSLDNKIALVTGAGRGIGRAIAVRFAAEGTTVIAAGRTASTLDEAVGEMTAAGGVASAHTVDVSGEASVAQLVKDTLEKHGRIDVLVNSAAIYSLNRFHEYTFDEWRQIIDVNLNGTFLMCREVVKPMMERGSGSIINLASTAGKWGSMYQSAYNASKHAVIGLTRCLSLEVAKYGIRVNAICPGAVDSPMMDEQAERRAELFGLEPETAYKPVIARIPIGRMVAIDEIPPLAVYLASNEAAAMTGQAITLDGGVLYV